MSTTTIAPRYVPAGQGTNVNVFGSDHRMLATGAQTGGSFAQFQNTVPPQGGPMLHVHHCEDETFYVLEGRFAFHIGPQVIEAGPGDYVLAPRDLPHTFINIGATPGKMLITVTPAGLEEFFVEARQILADDPTAVEAIIALGRRYHMELCAPKVQPRDLS